MSCGFSPKTFAMIQQMQEDAKRDQDRDKRKKVAYEKAKLEAIAKKASRLKDRAGKADGADGEWDWSRNYQDWDDWVDEEELEEKRRKAEEEAQKPRRQVPGCNHDHSAEKKLVDMSTADKLRGCQGFREEGNAWFREGQHFRAGEKFRKALVWLEYTFADDDEEERQVDEIRLQALINLAVCKLKTQQYDEVKENCYQALKLDPSNVKALYCRAQALRRTDHFSKAQRDIMRAVRLAPRNVEVRKELVKLRNQIRRYKQRTAQVSKAMFRGDGDVSSSGIRGGDGARENRGIGRRVRPRAPPCQSALTYEGAAGLGGAVARPAAGVSSDRRSADFVDADDDFDSDFDDDDLGSEDEVDDEELVGNFCDDDDVDDDDASRFDDDDFEDAVSIGTCGTSVAGGDDLAEELPGSAPRVVDEAVPLRRQPGVCVKLRRAVIALLVSSVGVLKQGLDGALAMLENIQNDHAQAPPKPKMA